MELDFDTFAIMLMDRVTQSDVVAGNALFDYIEETSSVTFTEFVTTLNKIRNLQRASRVTNMKCYHKKMGEIKDEISHFYELVHCVKAY